MKYYRPSTEMERLKEQTLRNARRHAEWRARQTRIVVKQVGAEWWDSPEHIGMPAFLKRQAD